MTEAQTPTTTDNSWQLVATSGWLAGQSFTIRKHAILGRDAECDITIPGTHLSRRHAEIAVSGDTLQVRDLGSANGTFINEQPVTEGEMRPGDTIRFDVLSFTVKGPATHSPSGQGSAPSARTQPAPKQAHLRSSSQSKPTLLGNRDKTVHMTAIQKTSSVLTVLAAVVLGLGCLAAIGYLIMQL
jgi:hypothetical protein